MIRVRVPLDLHSVSVDGSGAFALATPLRVREVLAMAVRSAIGKRAPADIFARSVRCTLAGLESGDFAMTVDGRIVSDMDAVVVCDAIADVRFFMRARRPLRRSRLLPER